MVSFESLYFTLFIRGIVCFSFIVLRSSLIDEAKCCRNKCDIIWRWKYIFVEMSYTVTFCDLLLLFDDDIFNRFTKPQVKSVVDLSVVIRSMAEPFVSLFLLCECYT